MSPPWREAAKHSWDKSPENYNVWKSEFQKIASGQSDFYNRRTIDPENRVAIAGIREEGREALPKGYCQRSGDKRPRNQRKDGRLFCFGRIRLGFWSHFLLFLITRCSSVGNKVEATWGL